MNNLPTSSDFSEFCDYVVQLRQTGSGDLTPEQSVAKFRQKQEQLRRWHELNAISIEQTKNGQHGPLDDEAIIARLKARWAQAGITD